MPPELSNKIPAIYYKCKERFGVSWEEVVITYGNVIYSKEPLSQELQVHESVHVQQQGFMGAEPWWKQYFEDPVFRLHEEVEAYRHQMKFVDKNYKDRNARARRKHKIWSDMATKYDGMCTYSEAKKLVPWYNKPVYDKRFWHIEKTLWCMHHSW